MANRASFPGDTMSTHFLWQRGAARLKARGLLGRLQACGLNALLAGPPPSPAQS